MKKATTWDAADYLETEADIAAYLNAAFEDGDTSVIAAALGDVARAKGMTQLAKETGITRDGLYKALSPTGNPSFDTVQKVVNAFGLQTRRFCGLGIEIERVFRISPTFLNSGLPNSMRTPRATMLLASKELQSNKIASAF